MKYYANKAQLVRDVAEKTGEPLDALWEQLEAEEERWNDD